MAYFSPKKPVRRSIVSETVSGNQVYDMIQENLDNFREYHDTEPAIVTRVYTHQFTLPKKYTTDGDPKGIPDYSYQGTINARFIMGTENLPEHIKPLSLQFISFPLVGEIVLITRIAGEYYYHNLPLNVRSQVSENIVKRGVQVAPGGEDFGGTPGGTGIAGRTVGSIISQRIKFNRRLNINQGDTVIQGRFGNHVQLTSDNVYENPKIKLINGQAQYPEIVNLKNMDPDYSHYADINNDGSSIYMESGKDRSMFLPSYKSPSQRKDPQSYGGGDHLPEFLYGNQIIINSDRLIFNAKGNPNNQETLPAGSIHMFATDQINLASNGGLYVETGDTGLIALGTDADKLKNPVVKGKELQSLLKEILSAIKEFSHKLGHSSGAIEEGSSGVKLDSINDAGHACRDAMDRIEKAFLNPSTTEDDEIIPPKIFSKRTFTI